MPNPPPNSDALRLTEELIARASVSPTDGGCQAMMIERLEAVGFTVERMRFGPVDNFWAKRGRGGPVFCFAGHTDVVPRARWTSGAMIPSGRSSRTASCMGAARPT